MPALDVHVQNSKTPTAKSHYMDCIIREVTEVALHPNSMNKKDGIAMSKSWKPPIYSLKECQKLFHEDAL
jgi:hypothetical protein